MEERGCVLEIREASMMVMTSDCQFKEIVRQDDAKEGMAVVFSSGDVICKKRRSYRSYIAAAAAVVLLILSTFTFLKGWQAGVQATAILTIDINPSIELSLYDNRVIAVRALNSEARQLPLKQLVKKTPVEAIDKVIQLAALKGFMPDEEGYVLVASVVLGESEKGLQGMESLLSELKDTIEAREISGKTIHLYTVTSDKETLEKAKEEQLSVGRMEIIKQLEEKDNSTVDYNVAKGRGVKELVNEALEKQSIKDQKQQKKEEKKSTKEEEKTSRERAKEKAGGKATEAKSPRVRDNPFSRNNWGVRDNKQNSNGRGNSISSDNKDKNNNRNNTYNSKKDNNNNNNNNNNNKGNKNNNKNNNSNDGNGNNNSNSGRVKNNRGINKKIP